MNYLAKADNPSTDGWALYIGRWQPWHGGHRWLIVQQLGLGNKVWIAIRDMEPNDKNPFTAEQVKMNIESELADLIRDKKVMVSIVPDVLSVNFGRGVGYDIIEHVPPTEVGEISATKVREEMKQRGEL